MNGQQAIRLDGLTKTFGKGSRQVKAVNDIELAVEPGQVYGFLGPNGAGKTTTIRLLLGLIRPTSGQAFIFGQDVNRHPEVLRRVGALVEGATFYNFLSAYDNLAVLARTANDFRPERIVSLLAEVGLAGRADRRVNGYSTGMKQRLGIAAAMLSDPELVILDEPTNGLDPAGIQEMRGFIRDLAEGRGKTVFLSSHLLREVEQTCDQVAIINHGEIIRHGAVASLLSGGPALLRLQVTAAEDAARALAPDWPVESVDGWLHVQASTDQSPAIVRRLVAANVDVHQVIVERRTLEDYFLAVTGSPTEVSTGRSLGKEPGDD
jgi:ABC-2 type transport system ATP-binding protein